MSTLLATSGHHVGRRFSLGEKTRLGRAPDNEICLPDSLVSRYHAEVVRVGAGYMVNDCGSKNGILVNDKRETEVRLKRGDRLRIGETVLVFEAPQELKTARFTNTLIHLDPDQDDTMRVVERPSLPEMASSEDASQLILKLAQVFETASADLPEVMRRVLQHMCDLFGASAGSIFLRGRNGEIVPMTAITDGDELHLSRDSARMVLEDGKAVLAASLFTAENVQKAQRRARKAMIAPLFDRDKPFGAIHLERPEGSDYTLKDITFLQALSRLAAGAIRQAIRIDQMRLRHEGTNETIIGASAQIEEVRRSIERVANTDSTVLVTGETGTGKELVAHALHTRSTRMNGPFVAINCAAIPEALIESELFGHERGAFTGAESMKRGKIEMADGGTLFLDEIGELGLNLQPKLLRFLEERIFYRVGGTRPIQTDVRIIAATNRDLELEVLQSRFRKDLLFRLNVLCIHLPPLRQRREDIRAIVNQRAPELAARLGKPFMGIDDQAWALLESYKWPGNVRELLQSLERALILSDNGLLRVSHFQLRVSVSPNESTTGTHRTRGTGEAATPGEHRTAPPTLAEVEKRAIIRALRYAGGNKNKAAELLSIHRNTLRKKMVEYDIK